MSSVFWFVYTKSRPASALLLFEFKICAHNNYAKFLLEPLDLAKSVGHKNIELSEIRRLIQEDMLLLKASWDAQNKASNFGAKHRFI